MSSTKRRDLSRARQLARLIQKRIRRRILGTTIAITILFAAIYVPLVVVPHAVRRLQALRGQLKKVEQEPKSPTAAVLATDQPGVIFVAPENREKLALTVSPISDVVPQQTISLDGILYLDPEDYVAVRSRFPGEFVDVAMLADKHLPGGVSERSIRFGDEVKQGQVLGAVWSRELGEKKSELAQYVSSLRFDKDALNRLSKAEASIPASIIRDAERRVRDNLIQVERIEKTLRSWQLSREEIQSILDEIEQQKDNQQENLEVFTNRVDQWARVEIRSPIEGTIIEKNVTVGTMLDSSEVLFKVANLNHLDVRAFAYEEDIESIQRLKPEERNWSIQLKSDANADTIPGVFGRIGEMIDPVQHTGLIIGWVDNEKHLLRPGQFIIATIVIPDAEPLVAFPSSAVVEYDGSTYAFVQPFDDSSRLECVEIGVVRYQGKSACVRVDTDSKSIPKLDSSMSVASSSAMELLAELQKKGLIPKTHIPSIEPPKTVDSNNAENADLLGDSK